MTRTRRSHCAAAHFSIDCAACIYQRAPAELRTDHTGVSRYLGRTNWDDFAIGITVERRPGQPWQPDQRAALAWLCKKLIVEYSISQQYVVAHRWVAAANRADPYNWPNAELDLWIADLYRSMYRFVRAAELPVYQDIQLTQPTGLALPPGSVVAIAPVRNLARQVGWLASGAGYIDIAGTDDL